MIKEMHEFIETKLLVGKKSEVTLDSYSRWLEEFCKITNIQTLDDFLALKRKDLNKYVGVLNSKNQSSSVWTKVMSVRSFYSYLILDEDCPCTTNLMAKIEIGKPEIKEVHPPTKNDIIDTLVELKKNKTYYALITLIASTGLRISEALSIKISDLYGNQIKVLGKGNKERIVYLNDDVLEIIENYINNDRHEKPLLSKEEFDTKGWTKFNSYETYANHVIEGKELLFISKTGIKMDTSSVRKTLKKYAEQAGVDLTKVQFCPHKLRSSFATREMINGTSISLMKGMLGHSSINTTMRYFGANQQEKQEAFQMAFNFGKELNTR